jgi:hypothetical protein
MGAALEMRGKDRLMGRAGGRETTKGNWDKKRVKGRSRREVERREGRGREVGK